MTNPTQKDVLHGYLRMAREALVWKLEGLSEYDVRRPLTRTGTNLLGLVKHLASVEYDYFGTAFDRPPADPLPWFDDGAEPNADLWATAEESRDDILGLYRRATAHADATIEELPLEAVTRVAWWPPERREATLHTLLIHVITDSHRHAGHADIMRELIDGSVGLRPSVGGLPDVDDAWWASYCERLESVAREVDGG